MSIYNNKYSYKTTKNGLLLTLFKLDNFFNFYLNTACSILVVEEL